MNTTTTNQNPIEALDATFTELGDFGWQRHEYAGTSEIAHLYHFGPAGERGAEVNEVLVILKPDDETVVVVERSHWSAEAARTTFSNVTRFEQASRIRALVEEIAGLND